MNARRAVFLDRDGVLNRALVRDGKPYPPAALDELEILPGVPEGLGALRRAGFALIVATNQPDVARGKQRREVVEAMHDRLRQKLPLDDIMVCFDDGPDCPDRKPNPGLLVTAAQRHNLILSSASFMVGDRWRDIDAGHRAGCRTILIDYHYQERSSEFPPDYKATTFAEAVQWMLQPAA